MTDSITPRSKIAEHAKVTLLELGPAGKDRNPYPLASMLHAVWNTEFDRALLSDELEGSAA